MFVVCCEFGQNKVRDLDAKANNLQKNCKYYLKACKWHISGECVVLFLAHIWSKSLDPCFVKTKAMMWWWGAELVQFRVIIFKVMSCA